MTIRNQYESRTRLINMSYTRIYKRSEYHPQVTRVLEPPEGGSIAMPADDSTREDAVNDTFQRIYE